ncbi:MAG: hypothetical protein KKE52_08065 [Alphaproteobacteria bacterium]|nr:hypothetical protein [Alphaproteobacteria bacterium]MBU2271242.1 hypothetical protein [Alphaproteobacteria bacterium]
MSAAQFSNLVAELDRKAQAHRRDAIQDVRSLNSKATAQAVGIQIARKSASVFREALSKRT